MRAVQAFEFKAKRLASMAPPARTKGTIVATKNATLADGFVAATTSVHGAALAKVDERLLG